MPKRMNMRTVSLESTEGRRSHDGGERGLCMLLDIVWDGGGRRGWTASRGRHCGTEIGRCCCCVLGRVAYYTRTCSGLCPSSATSARELPRYPAVRNSTYRYSTCVRQETTASRRCFAASNVARDRYLRYSTFRACFSPSRGVSCLIRLSLDTKAATEVYAVNSSCSNVAAPRW